MVCRCSVDSYFTIFFLVAALFLTMIYNKSNKNIRVCWLFVFFLSVLLNTYFFFMLHRYSKKYSSLKLHEIYYSWVRREHFGERLPTNGWSEFNEPTENAFAQRHHDHSTVTGVKKSRPDKERNDLQIKQVTMELPNEAGHVSTIQQDMTKQNSTFPFTEISKTHKLDSAFTKGITKKNILDDQATIVDRETISPSKIHKDMERFVKTNDSLKSHFNVVENSSLHDHDANHKTSTRKRDKNTTSAGKNDILSIQGITTSTKENLSSPVEQVKNSSLLKKVGKNVTSTAEGNENKTSTTENTILPTKLDEDAISTKKDETTRSKSDESVSSLSKGKRNSVSIREQFMTNNTILKSGLIVDWYKDIGVNRTMYNIKWHPLFPHMPYKSTLMTSLTENAYIMKNYARRIHGYLISNESAMFEFQLGSRDGMDFCILKTNMNKENNTRVENLNEMNILLNASFTVNEMIEQDKKIGFYDIFKKTVSAYLEKNSLYFVDILQAGGHYGRLDIKWRKKGESKFKSIVESFLFHHPPRKEMLHKYTIYKKPLMLHLPSRHEKSVMSFNKISTFRLENLEPNCQPFVKHRRHIAQDTGVALVEQWSTYPEIGFGYNNPHNKSDVVLNDTEAAVVVEKTLQSLQLNLNSSGNASLVELLQVSKNFNTKYKNVPQEQQFYFVEADIKIDEKIERLSKYVQVKTNGELCFRNDFNWSDKAKIYLMTPVRNQAHWVHHLLHSIEQIIDAANEKNVELILVDYNSTDGDIKYLLENHRVPYQYVFMNATMFNKVEGLNIALNRIDNESIAFVLDLHLEIPNNLFDKIRKHTIKGVSAYCPTLLKLYLGTHQMYTGKPSDAHWAWMDMGYGMMSMYKSDWMNIGGMNEKKFGTAWGGEDWEVVDRLLRHGYYLFHMRLPRFYHIYHSNHDIWDGTKL